MVAMAIQKSATMDTAGIQIAASDRDQGAIRITQSNASRAGVLNYIQVESCAFTKHPWLSHPSNTPPKLLLAPMYHLDNGSVG
jgi:23S rRNA G2445 N2-methylase RlmL